ncbi:MAG: hypothetical protein KF819_08595 [Labilithrix sp.]|nr:hypothetical protein [Labilithrix sp.]
MRNFIRLSSLRIQDCIVVALRCSHVDFLSGPLLVEIVDECRREGATSVVFDFPPDATIDQPGALALARASALLGGRGALRLSGLGTRARALIRSVCRSDGIFLVEWWGDGVELPAKAPSNEVPPQEALPKAA